MRIVVHHHHLSRSWHLLGPILVLWLNPCSPSELGRWDSTLLLSGTTWGAWQREGALVSCLLYILLSAHGDLPWTTSSNLIHLEPNSALSVQTLWLRLCNPYDWYHLCLHGCLFWFTQELQLPSQPVTPCTSLILTTMITFTRAPILSAFCIEVIWLAFYLGP